ncbi:MAG: putative spermidine/putrescine transport system permease protein [Arcobacteraceae bacterium]|jgi:putative spermidine/putrescine transport system permease protein
MIYNFLDKYGYKNFNLLTKFFSYGVFLFLVLPILILVPLSFNSGSFFTFTPEMLSLDPSAFSLRWYEKFFNSESWMLAVKNSFFIAIVSSIVAIILGTVGAMGLNSEKMPFKGLVMILLISPMIVPLIILATGMYFFYSYTGLLNTYTGIIIAHAILGVPFVVINVLTSLNAYDKNLTKASYSLGANPVSTFFNITFPIIRPGIISGGLFAFITSFDEVVIIIFLASPEQGTIPKQMFSGLREQISPTILAASTLLLTLSIILLLSIQYLERRKDRLRGVSELQY